ncbi:MAG: response regulator [Candidatus Nomurabacteria bacterium]|nr:response regulator [Candidatus Nomurabacteria bacterium]
MKIIVVDDSKLLIESIKRLFNTQTTDKHEFLDVLVSNDTPLSNVISKILEFKYDIIFMDDNLATYYTGKDITEKLEQLDEINFDKNKFIGTYGLSRQEYCGHQWYGKTIWEKPSGKQASLFLLFKILEKIKVINDTNFSIH